MPFHKLTLNRKLKFATLHNYGCSFKCPVCSYKLKSGADGVPGQSHPKPEKFLSVKEIKAALEKLDITKINFMGGEPSIAKELPEILDFAKNSLGLETWLGHTNGFNIPLFNLDGANVGFKAWDGRIHNEHTGVEKSLIYDNFKTAFERGIKMKANIVHIPGLVDIDQIEALSQWLAGIDKKIPLHLMAYIPVPGQPFKTPSHKQTAAALKTANKHLETVTSSPLYTPSTDKNLWRKDERFESERVL